MRCLDQPDDLGLFRCGISHAGSPFAIALGPMADKGPPAIMPFLRSRSSTACSATTSFRAPVSWRRSLHLVRIGGPDRVAGETALAGLQELLRPAIIHRRRYALAAAQLGYALLAPQAFQHDADLLLGRKPTPRRTGGCPSRPDLPASSAARISVSSSLLGGCDEPEILHS
jgi:hypothetical protein